jgi:hypothetical protein
MFSGFRKCPDRGRRESAEALIRERGQLPDQIFSEPHPPRRPLHRAPGQLMCQLPIKLEDRNVSFAAFHFTRSDETIIATIVSSAIRRVAIELSLGKSAHVQPLLTLPFDAAHLPARDVLDHIVVLRDARNVAMIDGATRYILVADLGVDSVRVIRSPFGDITSIAASEHNFVCTGSDMMLRLYHIEEITKPVSSVASYRGKPICAAISTKFGIFVGGTFDGSVVICSMKTGDVKKVFSLGNQKPAHIHISPGWGFIAVCAERPFGQRIQWELLLFTVNGIEIGRTSLDSEVAAWDTVEDAAGFDFMSLALRSGNVYHFELYTLNLGTSLCREAAIVSVSTIRDLGAVAVVTRSGSILLVPIGENRVQ